MNISSVFRKLVVSKMTIIFPAVAAFSGSPAFAFDTDGCRLADVPEFDEYSLIYHLEIAADSDFGDVRPPYTVNNSGIDVAFDRVAYCMELEVGGVLQWVWVSMETFTPAVRSVGVPYNQTIQTPVYNLNVYAGGATVTTGTSIASGNIEFWDQRSLTTGSLGLGGNDALNDFDDAPNLPAGSGGSMQVHNTGAQETILAYNNWDSATNVDDVGIGNSPAGNPDWTGAGNAGTFTDRADIYVLVRKRAVFRHAGDGEMEGLGDGGNAYQADVDNPRGVAVDSSGNVYFADSGQHRIRMVTPGGIISTFAGTGVADFTPDGQLATNTAMNEPIGLAIDGSDNVYYTDRFNRRVRMIDAATGLVTTVAGNGDTSYNGDNIPATTAALRNPFAVDVSASGDIYIADLGNSVLDNGPRIRKVSGGMITTVAGNGSIGNAGSTGIAITEPLDDPWGVYVDANDNIYIADTGNHAVRIVDSTTGNMTVFAGNTDGSPGEVSSLGELAADAGLRSPRGVSGDGNGNIYIADYNNHQIHLVDANGMIRTVAGNGLGDFNGDGRDALRTSLNNPFDVVVVNDNQDVIFSDFVNDRTRLIATAAAANSPPTDITLDNSSVLPTAAANSIVGMLTTLDDDAGDTHRYELVTGIGDTDNALFSIGNTSTALRVIDPGTMAVGDYSVRIQTDDQNGGTFQEAFVIRVASDDPVPPVITLLGDATVNLTTGDAYVDAGATATDDVDGDITANIVTVSNVDTMMAGNYQVTYNVMDAGGNPATEVVRTVIVADDATPPVITLVGSAAVTVTRGNAYNDAGATATDNVDGDITANIVTVSNVNTATAGTYQVTYNVMDAAGNAATEVTRTVTVQAPVQPPVTPPTSSGGGSFGIFGLLFLLGAVVRRRIFVR
jgi:hypothetical protein